MQVYDGKSTEKDAHAAILEATKSWPTDKHNLDIIFVFHSTTQNHEDIANKLKMMFPNTQIAGCTTAGELIADEHLNHSLVLCGIQSSEINWQVGVLESLNNLTNERCIETLDQLTHGLELVRSQLDPKKNFCIIFPDGLSYQEENLMSILSEELPGIPLIGGSAGDDLAFSKTWVVANGKTYSNAATLVLGNSSAPFEIIKHQHFTEEKTDLVATEVDSENRIIYTLDGYPAVERYAQLLGLSVAELNPTIFSNNPITFAVNGDIYVRSIQQIGEKGSLIFYCGVEEGMVFHFGGHHDMVESLKSEFKSKQNDKYELLIACNCILRSLEAIQNNQLEPISKTLNEISEHVIGFDTYGEQFNGLHINQTLIGIAFEKPA